MKLRYGAFALLAALGALPALAFGHGYAGERFFPPTITTDDPFAADELAFPTVSYFKNPAGEEGAASRETDAGFEFDKLIVPHLSIGVSDTHSWVQPVGMKTANGWGNLSLNVKYELLVDGPHEFIVAVGVEAELGGTGSKAVGRDAFSTFTPALFFGKGFGDLPDALKYLKPFAVTGTVGQTIPTESSAANALEWGVAVEYQFSYLQQHVEDIGMGWPWKEMIPLVEVSGETGEDRGEHGTTGTVNPGVLFECQYFQIGAEALIPMNRDSGENVGAVLQVWWFLDDIEPQLFGKPIFGGG